MAIYSITLLPLFPKSYEKWPMFMFQYFDDIKFLLNIFSLISTVLHALSFSKVIYQTLLKNNQNKGMFPAF